MADFLLELLSEEVPARMQARARNDLARMFADCTSEAGLATGPIDVHSTPRRLVLVARDVAEQTEASREELKGPRTSAPDQALEGFLRKTGLSREQLEERHGVYFAVIEWPGRAAAEVIADAVQRIAHDVKDGRLRPGSVDEKTVKRYLDEPTMPDVDLFVRSSGEQRTSNFLLWQSAYAEMVFQNRLWPDYDRRHLWQAWNVRRAAESVQH